MSVAGSDLPGVLAEIAEAVGPDAAARVAEELGGRRVWIARNPGADSPLARAVGVDAARRIAAELGGNLELLIPMGGFGGPAGRRRRVAELLRGGLSQPQVAAIVGVHQRTVERVAAALRPDPRQPGLFED